MSYPAFFNQVRKITVHDPLAQLLGANSDGNIEYSYTDAVKLAGHSCPTVAGAYLMTLKALDVLYKDQTPQRGAIKVHFRDGLDEGVAGVIASVVGLLTGCAAEGGFKGLGGNYVRRDLLSFDTPLDDQIRFERVDTGASVSVSYHPEIVPLAPNVMGLLRKILAGQAQAGETEEFANGWQERVRKILEQIDNPALVVCA